MRSAAGNLDFGTLAIPAASDLMSVAIPIIEDVGFSVQLFWTGSPVGNWSIQGSCDPGHIEPGGAVTGVTHWSTVANSTAAAGGSAGDFVQNYIGTYFRWFRVVYIHTSGTGTITSAKFNCKGP